VQEGFAPGVIGYVMSAYFVGLALGSYLWPPLIRQVGHIRAYSALTASASAAAVAYVLLVDPITWALLRVVTGVCMVGFYLVIESWLNALAPNNRRGQFLSAYMVTTFLALGAAQYLLLAGDIGEFRLFAVSSIVISAAVVPVALTRVAQPQLIPTPRLHLLTLYRESPLGVVGTLVAGIVMGAFWGMMAVYSSKIGLSKNSIALLMGATILGGALLQWPIGMISDRVDRRSVLGATALVASGLAVLGFFYGTRLSPMLFALYFLFGGSAFSLYSLSVAHVNDQLRPEQALEASQGLLQLYGIGAALGPVMAGSAMEAYGPRSLPLLFAVAAGALVLFTLYRTLRRTAPPVQEQEPFIPMARTSVVSLEMDPRTDSRPREEPEP
jgi:MFS family permease